MDDELSLKDGIITLSKSKV